MSTAPAFHVRGLDEGLGDGQFMIDAYDASLPHLAAIGSGGQWGTRPFSERPNAGERIKVVHQALRYQSTGEGEPIFIFMAEAEIPSPAVDEASASARVRTSEAGKKLLPVGTATLSEGICPDYVRAQFHRDAIRKELEGTRDYLYLEALITDFRAGPWRKGAGAVLVEHARQLCRDRDIRILYADAYSGNDRKLVRYYEKLGFSLVDDFECAKPDGSTWPGAFLRLDVPA